VHLLQNQPAKHILSTANHDRDIAGLKYVYPVLSRRAGGLSIGINFNTNNACNWRCIYCQVPELMPGSAPEIDFKQLTQEFSYFLDYIQHGDFFEQYQIGEQYRVIKDIAISGNGEPTSLKNFDTAISILADIATAAGIFPASKFVLISNGSLMHLSTVQAGLKLLAKYQGEIWFKLDSATQTGRKLINNSGSSQKKLFENLKIASNLCSTKLQTCMFHYQNAVWTAAEKQAYLEFLILLQENRITLNGIMLYSLARSSLQPEAELLQTADIAEMQAFAEDIMALGYAVSIHS
jgi:wyosine [tRNA(Phe)-imidazoG37] synthetase (radical SAM superfamily)